MKKLSIEKLQKIKGGGCNKWMRRYRRAVNNGIEDEQYLRSLMWAFEECIDAAY